MTLTTVNSGGVKDDSIVNADIKSDAAIEGSKLDNPLQLPDDHKISFGTTGTGDLEIYHSGGNSFIHDGGAGGLYIRGSILGWRDSGNSNASWINTNSGAGVELYYAGNNKLETNSNGITVRHTAATAVTIVGANNTDSGIYFNDGANQGGVIYQHNGDYMSFRTSGTDDRLRIDSSGKVFIGSTSEHGPNAYHLANAGLFITAAGENALKVLDSTAYAANVGGAILLGGNYRSTGDTQPFVELKSFKENATDANYAYGFSIGTTPNGGSIEERLRIDSSGNVGIGTIAPSSYTNYHTLTIDGTSGGQIDIRTNGARYGDIYTAANAFHIRNKQASGSGDIVFHTTASGTCAERARITSSGNLNITDGNLVIGTGGHGIDFYNYGTGTGVTSNLLDDYEEGTFGANIKFGGASVGISHNTASGRYTRVGRLVTCSFVINLAAKGSSNGEASINALPFTSINDSEDRMWGFVTYFGPMSSVTSQISLYNTTDQDKIYLYDCSSTTVAAITDANFADNTLLRGFFQYHCV